MNPAVPEFGHGDALGLGRATSVPEPHQAPPFIPDHELLKKIGGGSYGEVWLARNKLGTLRAVKIVHRQTFEVDEHFEREYRGIQKFEPISRSHEGLVDILQVGGNEGCFYYVMELADDSNAECRIQNAELNEDTERTHKSDLPALHSALGTPYRYVSRTLSSELRARRRLTVAECLQTGLALSDALVHLHKAGLVHRDIKPSNIIFVGGRPKLADIGLVADIGEARSFVGTAGYIPPEGPGTPHADIYSLGKVLYQISTGRDRQEFPALPSDLRALADGQTLVEFNEILLKACEADPRRRYTSARAMHDDLFLLQAGHSVKKRHRMQERLVIGKIIAVGVVGLASLCLATWLLSGRLSTYARRHDTPQVEKQLTTNLDALNAYSQGRYAYNKNTDANMTNAIRFFERAIALDQNFAEAYAGLASCYTWLDAPKNWPKIRAPAQKALTLNPNLSEAHKCLALVKYMLDWRWAEAEQEFKRAIQLDPRDGDSLRAYGYYLKNMGRTKEAITVLTRAHELDPRLISTTEMLGEAFFAAGNYSQALSQYQTCLDLEPNRPVTHYYVGKVYEAQGLFLKAIDLYQEDSVSKGENTDEVIQQYAALRKAYNEGGTNGYWHKNLEIDRADPTISACELAIDFAQLGDKKSVFEYLGLAFQKHEVELVQALKTERVFDKFRGEPEFMALLKKMKWE